MFKRYRCGSLVIGLIARDTLAVQLTLPLVGRVEDFRALPGSP